MLHEKIKILRKVEKKSQENAENPIEKNENFSPKNKEKNFEKKKN